MPLAHIDSLPPLAWQRAAVGSGVDRTGVRRARVPWPGVRRSRDSDRAPEGPSCRLSIERRAGGQEFPLSQRYHEEVPRDVADLPPSQLADELVGAVSGLRRAMRRTAPPSFG